METPLAAVHRTAGARLAEYNGCVLPREFSGFETEYRAAQTAGSLFDANWDAVFVLTGRDRVKYLHAISSNDIKSLAEGRGTLALLLNPQGRILAELAVYALPEKLLVLSHASLRTGTLATLRKYVLGSQVQIEDLTEKLGSIGIQGQTVINAAAEALQIEIGNAAEPGMFAREISIDSRPCILLGRPAFGIEILAPREILPTLWEKLVVAARAQGGEPIGMEALNSLRLEAAVPSFPDDFNDAMIPHEAAVETTHISFNKGCYTGQEIVERVRSRGHVNRKRVLLKFSTQPAPVAGTKLRAGDQEVGFITSAGYSPKAGTAIGMGYVRREQLAPGSVVQFEVGTAEVMP